MSLSNHTPERPIIFDPSALVLLAAATLIIMANAAISPALPALEAKFNGNPHAGFLARMLVSAPSVTVVLFAPIAGWACDRFGKKRQLLVGVTLFVLSGTAGAFLPSLEAILASRLVLGLSLALVMTAQMELIGDYFEGGRRASFMGLQSAAVNLSGFVFIAVAGGISAGNAQLAFLVYALPLFLIPFALTFLSRDILGERLNVQLLLNAGKGSWEPWVLCGLAAGTVSAITVMSFFVMPTQLPFYYQSLGLDAASTTIYGLGALMITGGCVGLSYKAAQLRIGLAGVFAAGFLFMTVGYVVLGGADTVFSALLGPALIGAGYGLLKPNLVAFALSIAPASRRGAISGFVTTGIFLGQIVSPLLSTPLIWNFGFSNGFYVAALLLAILSAISIVFKLELIRRLAVS